MSVAFGRPIHPPRDDEIEDHHEAFRALTKKVEEAVISLRDEAPV